MKKLPRVQRINPDHVINNNRKMYYGKSHVEVSVDGGKYIDTTISELIRGDRYVFSYDVKIYTKDNVYDTRIAGVMGNNIITVKGMRIPVSDVLKLQVKK